MDLTTIDYGANQTSELELKDPVTKASLVDSENGQAIALTLVGIDSDAYKQAERRITNQKLAKLKGTRAARMTAEEIESNKIELLAACIVGWKNISLNAGQVFEYTPQNAKKLLLTLSWVLEQVEDFVEDRANFLKRK